MQKLMRQIVSAVATRRERIVWSYWGMFHEQESFENGWNLARGERNAWKSLCLQFQSTCKELCFPKDFAVLTFKGESLPCVSDSEFNWITSPLSGESCLVREPADFWEAFILWKKLSWFAIVSETCMTQYSSLRPTENMTMYLLSSPHGGTTWHTRPVEAQQQAAPQC